MINILYNVFIFPIELLIELSYIFVYRVTRNPALSVLGVSLAVSVFTLPLYFMAERHQRSERDIQKKMKREVDNIKAVFSGDERFMQLSAYYRQNGYHPLYSLRTSISLIIQIPFFIAAFHFLSNLEMIRGVSFGPIANLATPDSLLQINNFSINVLPITMTLINCLSALVYTKGLAAREKMQLYGMAAIFLVLLYNSPSGMVLYWTGNNLFSLAKNIIQKTRRPKIVALSLTGLFCFLLVLYVLFIHEGALVKRLFIAGMFTVVPVLPFVYRFLSQKKWMSLIFEARPETTQSKYIFLFSAAVLFLLSGLVIPASLIASSVQQFSFIQDYNSPFPFIFTVLIQSFGIFVFWPLCLYLMFPERTKQILSKIMAAVACVAILNVFLFPAAYGYLTVFFTFSERVISSGATAYLNFIAVIITVSVALLFMYRFKKVFASFLAISACASLLAGAIHIATIRNSFASFEAQLARDGGFSVEEQVFQFSKTGKNVLIIFLDRALSGFIPYMFEEKPQLYDAFDGFTWHRNTISFGGFSVTGIPGVFGGYEYAPLLMQARNDVPLVDDHNESLLMLPRIFSDHGFEVTVTDPPFANYSWIPDLSIFSGHPEINARNIIGRYTASWLSHRPYLVEMNIPEVIRSRMVRFSFFRFSPVLFRNFIYDRGDWLSANSLELYDNLSPALLNNYVSLYVLPYITTITERNVNNFIIVSNDLTHSPHNFLQAPYYVPVNEVTNIGHGPFAEEKHYHVNMASLLLLARWFDFLRENDVYDNSRIIIVSDHGRDLHSNFYGNIVLPNGHSLEAYLALLMVKDFNDRGRLVVDNLFMTNADVPLIALQGIVENPVNPWTGNRLTSDKEDGVTIATTTLWNPDSHQRYIFNIRPDEWLHVHTYVFDPANWTQVER